MTALLSILGVYWLLGSKLCLASATLTQEVDPPAIHLGDSAKVSITVTDGGWTEVLHLPTVDGITSIRLGRADIGGTQDHRTVISSFSIFPTRTGDFTIPAFDVKTQASEILHVRPITLHVVEAGQNIPTSYLQQAPKAVSAVEQAPSSANDTLTVLSATTGQPVKEVHFGPDGKPAYAVTPNDTKVSAGVNPQQVAEPNPPSQAVSKSTLAAKSPTGEEGQPETDASTKVMAPLAGSTDYVLARSQPVAPISWTRNRRGGWDETALLPLIEQIRQQHREAQAHIKVESDLDSVKLAATTGDVDAERKLGILYYNGKGVPTNYAESLKWLQKAADKGDVEAQDKIGNMYRNGWGVPKDYSQALRWFQKAAEKQYPPALYHIGILYKSGLGVPKDDIQAETWFKNAIIGIQKAADQGDAEAQDRMGNIYHDGLGVTVEYSQALSWYKKAADQGDADAQLSIGAMYYTGQGVPKDNGQALSWCQKAADEGDAIAQFNLGLMYATGEVVPQSKAQAIIWYQKAANQGLAEAQAALKLATVGPNNSSPQTSEPTTVTSESNKSGIDVPQAPVNKKVPTGQVFKILQVISPGEALVHQLTYHPDGIYWTDHIGNVPADPEYKNAWFDESDQIYHLRGLPTDLADGDTWKGNVLENGIFTYTTAFGTKSTVHSYNVTTPQP